MKQTMIQSLPKHALPKHQRGVVLLISLIVLVAMTLAAIGMVRSVDTATVVSGNFAFRQSALAASDQGLEAGYQWLLTNAGTPALNDNNLAQGFYSARPAAEPDWFASDTWTIGLSPLCLNACNPDAAGNVTSYVIHRMCTQPDTAYNGTNAGIANECALTMPSGGSSTGGSMAVGAVVFTGNPHIFYRITSRVAGPRNTVSVTQAMVMISN